MFPTTQSRKLLVALLAVALVGSTVAFATVTTTDVFDEHEATVQQDGQAQNSSYVRIVHASPGAAPVDVQVENETIAENVTFGTVTEYLELSAGTYNVTIVPTSDNESIVFEGEVTIDPRTVTTIAASGQVSEDTFEPVTFADNAFTPAENESAISVVHLSPGAPAVDVTAGNGSVVLADNVSYQNASEYATVPAGNYTVEIREATAGNNGTVVATVDVAVESGEAYSAFAIGQVNASEAAAETPFEVVLGEDATFTLNLPGDDMMNETDNETDNETGTETGTETEAETEA